MKEFDYSQTYLYKLHKLTNALDKVFDKTLRHHSLIGLSQFNLLLSVNQFQPVSQRAIATFLDLSPGAISRQVALAQESGLITVKDDPADRRGQILQLTSKGASAMKDGLATLEVDVFSIFDHSDTNTHLMGHIDLLLENIASLGNTPSLQANNHTLPKAADLFLTNGGDINRAAIDVQRAVGHHVSEKWWAKNIGETSNDIGAAQRFDEAYARYIQQIADIDK